MKESDPPVLMGLAALERAEMFPAHKARALSSFALERKGAQYERTRLSSVPRGPCQTARGLQEGGEGQRSSCSEIPHPGPAQPTPAQLRILVLFSPKEEKLCPVVKRQMVSLNKSKNNKRQHPNPSREHEYRSLHGKRGI
ncbi:hypothetical protein AOLI_G00070910 [Acnodon oligacanthus]